MHSGFFFKHVISLLQTCRGSKQSSYSPLKWSCAKCTHCQGVFTPNLWQIWSYILISKVLNTFIQTVWVPWILNLVMREKHPCFPQSESTLCEWLVSVQCLTNLCSAVALFIKIPWETIKILENTADGIMDFHPPLIWRHILWKCIQRTLWALVN